MFGFNPLNDPKLAWEDSSGNNTKLSKTELKQRLATYNRFHQDTHLELRETQSEVGNDDLEFEGQLRIYWGVKTPIHFQKLDETSITKEPKQWRRSYFAAIDNGLDQSLVKSVDSSGDTLKTTDKSTELVNDKSQQFRYNTLGGSEVQMRRKKPNRRVKRRLSMINGHLYDLETSIFTPTDGSVTSVTVTSRDPSPAVIKLLMHKFKVENNPDEFCLCAVKKSGEIKVLQDTESPMVMRVVMGPLEEEAKIWLRDRSKVKPISNEVAQYLGLPEPVLMHFLQKLEEDHLIEKQSIISKYQRLKILIEKKLKEVETPEWNMD